MNNTIETILNHRSIRKWKNEEVPKEIIEVLSEVANRTSTSIGMQTASIIRVKDIEKRKKIASITSQKYVEEAPEFWIFIADHYRNQSILEEEGVEENYGHNVDRFISGITDAVIMAQNVGNAIESLGMGFTIFGSILNDTQKIIDILELPKYTMPVLGLGFGYPNQNPELKPRMKFENRIFEDKYKIYDNYHDTFKEYDERLSKYYDLRNTNSPVDTFTKQAVEKYTKQNDKREEYLKVAKKQGYDL